VTLEVASVDELNHITTVTTEDRLGSI
jgi:hypothetical protein